MEEFALKFQQEEVIGLLKNENGYEIVKVRFVGKDDPGALRHNKIYDAVVGQLGMICLVDETGGEYAFPPHLFEIIED